MALDAQINTPGSTQHHPKPPGHLNAGLPCSASVTKKPPVHSPRGQVYAKRRGKNREVKPPPRHHGSTPPAPSKRKSPGRNRGKWESEVTQGKHSPAHPHPTLRRARRRAQADHRGSRGSKIGPETPGQFRRGGAFANRPRRERARASRSALTAARSLALATSAVASASSYLSPP